MLKTSDLKIVQIGLDFLRHIIQTEPSFLHTIFPKEQDEQWYSSEDYIQAPYIYIVLLAWRIKRGELSPSEVTTLEIPKKPSHILAEIPVDIQQLTHLKTLVIKNQSLSSLPEELFQLTALENLTLHSCKLTEVPEDILKLALLTKLDLSNNQISTIPEDIGDLSALTILRLSNNSLTTIPNSLYKLSNLYELCLAHNQIQTISEDIVQLHKLDILTLNDNPIANLTEGIRKLWISRLRIKNTLIPSKEAKLLHEKPHSYRALLVCSIYVLLLIITLFHEVPTLTEPDLVHSLTTKGFYYGACQEQLTSCDYYIQFEEPVIFSVYFDDSQRLIWMLTGVGFMWLVFYQLFFYVILRIKYNLGMKLLVGGIGLIMISVWVVFIPFKHELYINAQREIILKNTHFFGLHIFENTTTVENIERLYMEDIDEANLAHLVLVTKDNTQIISPAFPQKSEMFSELLELCKFMASRLNTSCKE